MLKSMNFIALERKAGGSDNVFSARITLMTIRHNRLRLTILFTLLLSIAACGEDGLNLGQTPTVPLTISTPTTVALPDDASTAARIRAQGYLLVGVRYDDEPFGIVDDEGELVGFDVDLAREFASRWLGDADAVRFKQVTNASADQRLRERQVDLVIGALPRTKDGAQAMAYSAAYYYDGLSLLIRTSGAITQTEMIRGPTDLDEKLVGVVDQTETEAPLLGAAGSAVPQVVYYPDYFSAVTGLDAGVVQAVVGPRRTLERLAAENTGLALTPRFTRDSYAIGVPKSDGSFRDLVNATLMTLIRDGTYSRLFDLWLPEEMQPDLEVWTGSSQLSFEVLGDTLSPPANTIQDIEEGGYLMVGLLDDHLPFSDLDANGVARGFESELARTFAGRWLDDVTAIQFAPHTEITGIAALKSGQIDLLIAGMPHTLPREDQIDFSQTIYQDGIGLLVSAESGINALSGVTGGTVAVPNDGTTAELVREGAAQTGIVLPMQTVEDANVALTGVAEGRYRAYADWRTSLLNLAYTNAGFLVLDDRLTVRPIAMGLRQNDAAFRDLVNFTLQEMAEEGRYAALYDDWFGTDPPYNIEIWEGVPYRPLRLRKPALINPTATP
jgi:polar amino acid transport system substrate-binding protein